MKRGGLRRRELGWEKGGKRERVKLSQLRSVYGHYLSAAPFSVCFCVIFSVLFFLLYSRFTFLSNEFWAITFLSFFLPHLCLFVRLCGFSLPILFFFSLETNFHLGFGLGQSLYNFLLLFCLHSRPSVDFRAWRFFSSSLSFFSHCFFLYFFQTNEEE